MKNLLWGALEPDLMMFALGVSALLVALDVFVRQGPTMLVGAY